MSLKSECNKSVGEKLLLAGGAASLALASGNPVEAAVVSALNTPISPPATHGGSLWDIDGDSTADFRLGHNASQGKHFGNITDLNGARLAATTSRTYSALGKLSAGVVVGPTMAGFHFLTFDESYRTITTNGTKIGGAAENNGWSFGDVGYFGFKFVSGPNTYYGWGELDIHGGTPGGGYTITQAYYNNTPGATITVGDTGGAIPEPSTCALALLAAGGVAAYRSRRKGSVA